MKNRKEIYIEKRVLHLATAKIKLTVMAYNLIFVWQFFVKRSFFIELKCTSLNKGVSIFK